MINSDCMYECEWCHADLGSDPKAYDEHVEDCTSRLKIIADRLRGYYPNEKEKSTNGK